jgi:hypothetical protein
MLVEGGVGQLGSTTHHYIDLFLHVLKHYMIGDEHTLEDMLSCSIYGCWCPNEIDMCKTAC